MGSLDLDGPLQFSSVVGRAEYLSVIGVGPRPYVSAAILYTLQEPACKGSVLCEVHSPLSAPITAPRLLETKSQWHAT